MAERSRRVLVLEEEPALLGLIALVLNRAGYCVQPLAASDDPAPQAAFSLAVVDLDALGAAAFVHRLRQNPATAGLPILALTGPVIGPADRRLCASCACWLPKPFELRQFVQFVDRLAAPESA